MDARTGLQSSSFDKTGVRTFQQQDSELKPSNMEITQAIWDMLAEEIKRNKLDVFQLQDFYVEGYVPSLSKKFGVPLENRRGEMWTAFRVCLDMQRGNKAKVKQARQPNKSHSTPVKSKKAPVLQTRDGSGLPPLRLPPGRLELFASEEKGRNVRKRLTKGCVRSGGARDKS